MTSVNLISDPTGLDAGSARTDTLIAVSGHLGALSVEVGLGVVVGVEVGEGAGVTLLVGAGVGVTPPPPLERPATSHHRKMTTSTATTTTTSRRRQYTPGGSGPTGSIKLMAAPYCPSG
ncbi:unannotated protein [freshwater metagenome]|uniref:Unannotated protein n=1 Tax=freshwater metagenome TaxID=449393 RepID=A0A6J7GKE6_9ZZZZ